MQKDAAHEQLTCNSCHGAHRYDTRKAAVQSCLSCHADRHSLAFESSPHFELWQKETRGELPPGNGVSCATCHMPRIRFDVNDWMSRIMVEHDQSAVQSPNSKMIRPACGHCHGQGFSLDALADAALIERNFNGAPATHVESMDLAREDKERRDAKGGGDTGMFGF
jgi:formate-dependent nitrite reductase cytochrome c552 subunit